MKQLKNLHTNIQSSFIVFLIALPLCLGIAIASGLTPEKGIISGAIGGVLIGLLGGGSFAVSGPANSLIVSVADIVGNFGATHLAAATVIAGTMQIATGAVSLGRVANYIPKIVSRGLMIGLAIIIIKSQIPTLLDNPRGTPFTFGPGAIIGMSSLAILLGLQLAPANALPQWLRKIPPALLVTAGAVLATALLNLSLSRVHVPDSLMDDFSLLQVGSINWLNSDILISGVTIFLLATMESLLNAKAIDELAPGHKTNPNKELIAQGFGNIVCGLVCAIPVAGVIIRSSANLRAGATNRSSTVLHGIWLLGMAAIFPFILDDIPMATLAAVLILAAWNLIQAGPLMEMIKAQPADGFCVVMTAILVFTVDVRLGIAAGFALNMLKNDPRVQLLLAPSRRSMAKWFRKQRTDYN